MPLDSCKANFFGRYTKIEIIIFDFLINELYLCINKNRVMNVQQESPNQRIKKKIDLLLSAYDKLKNENLKLIEQNQALENQLKHKGQNLDELEKRFNQAQLAKAVMASSDDVHDAKEKVKRIVREIDQCIALLNK